MLGEHQVAVIGNPLEHAHLACSADALGARIRDIDVLIEQGIENGFTRRHEDAAP